MFKTFSLAPDFIVEVISPSTRRHDVTIKKEIYEKYGVKEYWIISPNDEDWAALSDAEKAEQALSLKISLYNDLEIQVKDIFE